MVENIAIEKYIRENLNKGYSPEAIKERLDSSSYDPQIVDRIIYSQEQPKIPVVEQSTALNKTTERKRGILLTLWLILMLFSNAGTAVIFLLADSLIGSFFPTVPVWSFYIFGGFATLNIIFTIFLFMWKRWAFFAFCGSAGIVFAINLILGVGFESISGLLGPVILYLLIRSKWDLFE